MQALDAPDVPLIVDMSSHILSRDIDLTRFAMAYGGMQKNLGIAGVTFVILDEALIRERVKAPIVEIGRAHV